MSRGTHPDPFRGFNFRVNSLKFGTIAFQKVSGLNIGVEVAEYREGTDINTIRKLPGLATFENVTFERGVGDAQTLVQWMKQIVDLGNEPQLPSDVDIRSVVTVQLLSHRQQLVRQYTLRECWPVALNLGDMDASSSDVIIESLALCHEGLSIDFNGTDFPAANP